MSNQRPRRALGMIALVVVCLANGCAQQRGGTPATWTIAPGRTIIRELGGVALPIPLVLYPGAEVEAMTDSSSAMGAPTFAVLLGTPAAVEEVVRYYKQQFASLGTCHVSGIPRLHRARSVELSTSKGRQIATIFKGPRHARDPWNLPLSDDGEETKILINTPRP